MSEPEKHHYLPRFYLINWASKSDGKVQYFFREGERFLSSRISPKNTGYENNLYSLKKVAPENLQLVEKFLNKEFDSPASNLFKKIESSGINSFSHEEKELFARFLFSLRFRGASYLKKIKKDGKALLCQKIEEEKENLLPGFSPSNLLEHFENFFPGGFDNIPLMTWATTLKNSKVLARLCELHWWTLNLKGNSYQLLTSDNPFVILNNPIRSIYIPIGPYKAFFVSENAETEQRFIQLSKSKLVKSLNREIVSQAKSKIFSQNNHQEKFIEKYLPKSAFSNLST